MQGKEGDSLKLTCTADANPPLVTYTPLHNILYFLETLISIFDLQVKFKWYIDDLQVQWWCPLTPGP